MSTTVIFKPGAQPRPPMGKPETTPGLESGCTRVPGSAGSETGWRLAEMLDTQLSFLLPCC